MMKLKSHERIVTAYAAPAAGPGWVNAPLWVVIRDGDGKLREECLQPDEQSADMHTLYQISAGVNTAMIAAVRRALARK